MSRSLVPNSTQIPDIILDTWIAKLNGAEFKVLMYVARRTYGFGKMDGDAISIGQIAKGIVKKNGERLDYGTGLSRDTVCTALSSLEEKGIIRRRQRESKVKGHLPNFYSLNLNATLPEDSFICPEKRTELASSSACENSGSVIGSTHPPLSENPTRGPSPKIRLGGVRKSDKGLVQKSDTQETADQETEIQETAATLRRSRDYPDIAAAVLIEHHSPQETQPSASPQELDASKSPPDSHEQAYRLLRKQGYDEEAARFLADKHPLEQIKRQCDLIARRAPKKNRLGMLRRAIEENWPAPESQAEEERAARSERENARKTREDARSEAIFTQMVLFLTRMEKDHPEAFLAFLEFVEKTRADYAKKPIIRDRNPKLLQEMLAVYDQKEKRLELFVDYFTHHACPLSELSDFLQEQGLPEIKKAIQNALKTSRAVVGSSAAKVAAPPP